MTAFERLPKTSADAVAASFRSMAPALGRNGARLYAMLCSRIPDDPELVAITAHGLAAYPALQLLAAVHFLLLRDPRDPLAQYYSNLTERPLPPEEAFPVFSRFCKSHREEILQIVKTRTIQATTVERCQLIMPMLSYIADMAGEPLDLIEIGCSAGVLLTFDKYAYELKGRGRLGSQDAPLTLGLEVRDGPELHIPKIGKRIGLDLSPVNVKSEEERRWLLAQLHPEAHEMQSKLATAMETIARTDISFAKGDALDLLPQFITESPGALCIFHSACVVYWTAEAKDRLEALLLDASRGRELYRVSVEPDLQKVMNAGQFSATFTEVVVSCYRNGTVDHKLVARSAADNATITWLN